MENVPKDEEEKDEEEKEGVILDTQREMTNKAMTEADEINRQRTELFDKAAEAAKVQRRLAADEKQIKTNAATQASRIAYEAANKKAADEAANKKAADEEAAAAVLKYFEPKTLDQIFDELTRTKPMSSGELTRTKPMSPGLQKALFSDLNSNYNTPTNFVKKLFYGSDERNQMILSIQSELNDRLNNVREILQVSPLNEEDHLKYIMIMMLLKNEKELLMDENLTMRVSDIDLLKKKIELLKEKIEYKHCEGKQCNVSGGYQKMRKSKTAKKQKKSTTAKKQKKRKTSTAKKQKKNRKSKTSKR
jgi:hypothetical protein